MLEASYKPLIPSKKSNHNPDLDLFVSLSISPDRIYAVEIGKFNIL